MRVIFYLATMVTLVRASPHVHLDCSSEGEITIAEIVTPTGVTIEGCEQSYFIIHLSPETSANYLSRQGFSLQISDGANLLPTFSNNFTQDVTLTTQANAFSMSGSGSIPLSITYKEYGLYNETLATPGVPADTIRIKNLVPNGHYHLDFDTVEGDQMLDLTWNFLAIENGFMALRSGNGRIALLPSRGVNSNAQKFVVNTPKGQDVLKLDVVTQNADSDLSKIPDVVIKFNLAQEEITTTTMASTTQPTINPDDNPVQMFVVAVNEINFVTNQVQILQEAIESWAREQISGNSTGGGTSGECNVDFYPVVSCRGSCQMTNNQDRGCAAFYINVRPNIFCPYSNSLLRRDITEDKVLELQNLAEQLGARRIIADNCLEGENGWLITSILVLVCAVLIIIVGGFIFRLVGRREFSRRESVSNSMKDLHMEDYFQGPNGTGRQTFGSNFVPVE